MVGWVKEFWSISPKRCTESGNFEKVLRQNLIDQSKTVDQEDTENSYNEEITEGKQLKPGKHWSVRQEGTSESKTKQLEWNEDAWNAPPTSIAHCQKEMGSPAMVRAGNPWNVTVIYCRGWGRRTHDANGVMGPLAMLNGQRPHTVGEPITRKQWCKWWSKLAKHRWIRRSKMLLS